VLGDAAQAAGAAVSAIADQGNWLDALGIRERAATLATIAPERREEIMTALDRLTDEDEMGELFKVLAIFAPGGPSPKASPDPFARRAQALIVRA